MRRFLLHFKALGEIYRMVPSDFYEVIQAKIKILFIIRYILFPKHERSANRGSYLVFFTI